MGFRPRGGCRRSEKLFCKHQSYQCTLCWQTWTCGHSSQVTRPPGHPLPHGWQVTSLPTTGRTVPAMKQTEPQQSQWLTYPKSMKNPLIWWMLVEQLQVLTSLTSWVQSPEAHDFLLCLFHFRLGPFRTHFWLFHCRKPTTQTIWSKLWFCLGAISGGGKYMTKIPQLGLLAQIAWKPWILIVHWSSLCPIAVLLTQVGMDLPNNKGVRSDFGW